MLNAFESSAPSLGKDEIERFSRQMLCEGIGACGMERIRQAHVVCVGMGGLGSTAALYLVAGGVGKLTLVDFDVVEMSNLHRQIIHRTDRVGQLKVESARSSCLALVPDAVIEVLSHSVTASNAEKVLCDADVVVDASDNVAARYVVNDAAMRLGKPLVSGSAMRWEGQLSVYGYNGGPCYRCLFPQPPPAAAVGSCNDTGVMGPVPGMIGCLQALEVFKVVARAGEPLSGRMFLFDALKFSTRVVKLRARQASCTACGEAAARTRAQSLEDLMRSGRAEYEASACSPIGAAYSHAILPESVCCSVSTFIGTWGPTHLCSELKELMSDEVIRRTGVAVVVAPVKGEAKCTHGGSGLELPSWSLCIDVRERLQYDMARLPHTFSLPLGVLQEWGRKGQLQERFRNFAVKAIHEDMARWKRNMPLDMGESHAVATYQNVPETSLTEGFNRCNIFVMCRRGVASAQCVQLLLGAFPSPSDRFVLFPGDATEHSATTVTVPQRVEISFFNVDGGLNAYHSEVNHNFPFY